MVVDPQRFVEFLRKVFAASGDYEPSRPSVISIGDSRLITGSGIRAATPALLYIDVPDTDATYRRALDAGAWSFEAPADLPYGDQRAMVEDAWVNIWQIATHLA